MTSPEENSSNKKDLNKEITYSENSNSEDINNIQRIEIDKNYTFGWSSYSEKTNGRFAMIGFAAIIIIELLSQKPFLNWAGIL